MPLEPCIDTCQPGGREEGTMKQMVDPNQTIDIDTDTPHTHKEIIHTTLHSPFSTQMSSQPAGGDIGKHVCV